MRRRDGATLVRARAGVARRDEHVASQGWARRRRRRLWVSFSTSDVAPLSAGAAGRCQERCRVLVGAACRRRAPERRRRARLCDQLRSVGRRVCALICVVVISGHAFARARRARGGRLARRQLRNHALLLCLTSPFRRSDKRTQAHNEPCAASLIDAGIFDLCVRVEAARRRDLTLLLSTDCWRCRVPTLRPTCACVSVDATRVAPARSLRAQIPHAIVGALRNLVRRRPPPPSAPHASAQCVAPSHKRRLAGRLPLTRARCARSRAARADSARGAGDGV